MLCKMSFDLFEGLEKTDTKNISLTSYLEGLSTLFTEDIEKVRWSINQEEVHLEAEDNDNDEEGYFCLISVNAYAVKSLYFNKEEDNLIVDVQRITLYNNNDSLSFDANDNPIEEEYHKQVIENAENLIGFDTDDITMAEPNLWQITLLETDEDFLSTNA